MAMDLAQLQQLLNQGAQAKTQLAGLDAPTAQAAALRDQPIQTKNAASGLFSVLGRELGRSRERDLAPQRAAATGDVNRLSSTMDMYKLQQQEAARTQSQTNVEEGRALQQTLQTERLKAQQERADASATAKLAKETKDREEDDVKEVKKVEALKQKALAKQKEEAGKSPYPKMTGKRLDDFRDISTAGRKKIDVFNAFDPEFAKHDVLGMKDVEGVKVAGDYALWRDRTFAASATDEDRKASNWWADYKNAYELPTRHEMFGSALTDNEIKEWAKASINPGMTGEQIQERLASLREVQETVLRRMGENAALERWPNDWLKANLKSYAYEAPAEGGLDTSLLEAPIQEAPAAAPPPGITPEDWATLSPQEQAFELSQAGG